MNRIQLSNDSQLVTGVFIESIESNTNPELRVGDVLVSISSSNQNYSVEYATHEEIQKILSTASGDLAVEVVRPALTPFQLTDFIIDPRQLPWLLSFLQQSLSEEDRSRYEAFIQIYFIFYTLTFLIQGILFFCMDLGLLKDAIGLSIYREAFDRFYRKYFVDSTILSLSPLPDSLKSKVDVRFLNTHSDHESLYQDILNWGMKHFEKVMKEFSRSPTSNRMRGTLNVKY